MAELKIDSLSISLWPMADEFSQVGATRGDGSVGEKLLTENVKRISDIPS